jgi:hypothetical protein
MRNTIRTSRARDYLGPDPFDVFNIDTSDVRKNKVTINCTRKRLRWLAFNFIGRANEDDGCKKAQNPALISLDLNMI